MLILYLIELQSELQPHKLWGLFYGDIGCSKLMTDDRAVARVLKGGGGFDQILFVGALLDPSQIQLGGLGERCKLPQRGLGRSPRR